MPKEDAQHWDERYRERSPYGQTAPREILVAHHSHLPHGGLILDAAMGLGANSQYLASLDYRVIGVDISIVALRQAKQRCPAIQAVLADLTELRFPSGIFDGILNFYYLDRSMWAEYKRMLKPGGMIFIETLGLGIREIHPDIDPLYLLQPGELRQAFEDWEIRYYREGWQPTDHGTRKSIASLVARKPG